VVKDDGLLYYLNNNGQVLFYNIYKAVDNPGKTREIIQTGSAHFVGTSYPAVTAFCLVKNHLLTITITGLIQKFFRSGKSVSEEYSNSYWKPLAQNDSYQISLPKDSAPNFRWTTICANSVDAPVVCSLFDEMNCRNILYIINYDLSKASQAPARTITLANQQTPIHSSCLIKTGRTYLLICSNYLSTINLLNCKRMRVTLVKSNVAVTRDRIISLAQVQPDRLLLYGSSKCLYTIVFCI
jgi:hypothetical protein